MALHIHLPLHLAIFAVVIIFTSAAPAPQGSSLLDYLRCGECGIEEEDPCAKKDPCAKDDPCAIKDDCEAKKEDNCDCEETEEEKDDCDCGKRRFMPDELSKSLRKSPTSPPYFPPYDLLRMPSPMPIKSLVRMPPQFHQSYRTDDDGPPKLQLRITPDYQMKPFDRSDRGYYRRNNEPQTQVGIVISRGEAGNNWRHDEHHRRYLRRNKQMPERALRARFSMGNAWSSDELRGFQDWARLENQDSFEFSNDVSS